MSDSHGAADKAKVRRLERALHEAEARGWDDARVPPALLRWAIAALKAATK